MQWLDSIQFLDMLDPNQEQIVYVHSDGTPTGEIAPKLDAHTANTRLHSAFSCYIFNDRGEVLVTRRAHRKKVWPDVWTNSVCGHPAPDEPREDAVFRRASYELGMKLRDLQLILPTYTYKAPPYNGIIEHEFCPVYVAFAGSDTQPNPEEVEDYKWLPWADFTNQLAKDASDVWSWWCKDQVNHLVDNKKFQAFLASI